MSQPGWKKMLPTPPAGGELLGAWFTTYDQPDASLLVEHLLPSLLGLDNALTPELNDRNMYFGELGTALEALHGRITVISSPPRGERAASQYPWLWRYVSHFMVGEKSHAVQHAKLWAFHWRVGDDESLELYVSSTNLTTSAFKGQVQAGWTHRIPFEIKSTKSHKESWGDLVPFLNELGASAGDNAKASTDRLVQLLEKAECPDGTYFVASIPGEEKRGTHAIRKLKPSAIHVLTPTVGGWDKASVAAWSKDAGINPADVHLKWIDKDHLWARDGGWTLTEEARKSLQDADVQLNHLKPDVRFTSEHADGDERWSHAKIYLIRIRNKKKRFLLLTSANWSASAWGAGKEKPRNFELGVLFETEWKWPEEIRGKLSDPFCTERVRSGESKLQWAEAAWDGKQITLKVRSSDAAIPINATISFSGGLEQQQSIFEGCAKAPWSNAELTPLAVQFTQGVESIEVAVIDLRPPRDFAKTPLPEVDPSRAEELREGFLLQRYGGPVVDAGTNSGANKKTKPGTRAVAAAADYSVQAWMDARAAFGVVDAWRTALGKVKESPIARKQVLSDGKQLQEIYMRRKDNVGLQLAAEELEWRLQEETP